MHLRKDLCSGRHSPTGVPQLVQNLFCGGTGLPQVGQMRSAAEAAGAAFSRTGDGAAGAAGVSSSTFAPQQVQKRLPSGTGLPQVGQVLPGAAGTAAGMGSATGVGMLAAVSGASGVCSGA